MRISDWSSDVCSSDLGGDVPKGPGYFVPLTVVRDVEEGSAIVDEEPFGPILPIIRYSDVDDVIARANASPFALGGSVWSSDPQAAAKVALRLDSGSVDRKSTRLNSSH